MIKNEPKGYREDKENSTI